MIERWDDLRFILALARERTLTAAATALGVSQPTVGRRISVLEKKVGTLLIERRPEGYRLSDAGQAVVAQAERIEAAVLAADRATAFNSRRIRGTVKLTSAEWLCGTVLAPALARFGQRHPDMTVELVAEARWINLPRGESNLAIRGARFEHPGLLQRRVAISEVGVYATSEYLKARGLPDLAAGSPGHCFVTLTEEATEETPRGSRPTLRQLRSRHGQTDACCWRRSRREAEDWRCYRAWLAMPRPDSSFWSCLPCHHRASCTWECAPTPARFPGSGRLPSSWWPRSRRWRRSSRLGAAGLAVDDALRAPRAEQDPRCGAAPGSRSQALPPPCRVLRQAPASVLEEPPGSDTPLRVFGAPQLSDEDATRAGLPGVRADSG